MALLRRFAGSLVCLLVLTATLHAEGPPSPLRLVPDKADLVLEVPRPRVLLETVTALEAFQQLQQLDAVRDYYDSLAYRRFQKLLTYFEKELGAKWPELLDRLAGGGMVLAVKTGPNPAPVLLVVQSKDAKLMDRFVELGFPVLTQAVGGVDAKEAVEKRMYREVQTYHLGKDFHAAVVDGALLISNQEPPLNLALDLAKDGPAKSVTHVAAFTDSRKLLRPHPLARVWYSLDSLHKLPEAKDIFTLPRPDQNLTVAFGGWLDVFGRAPYVCAGLYREKDGFRATVQLPAGREGSNPGMALHIPPADFPGVRPLLEPKGVLYSSSFYLDIAKVWDDRAKMFNAAQVKALEEGNKNIGRFLAGIQYGKLITQVGANHRVVVVHQAKPGYTIRPAQEIPAFAVVTETRDPEFGKSMNTILRGAGLLAGAQANLKLVEEKQGEHAIVGYRFPEDGKFPGGDPNNLRFNFSPCFVAVGDQFVFCSTIELAHELVDLLDKEQQEKPLRLPTALRSHVYARGGAEFLSSIEDILLTQAILGSAQEPDAARKQVKDFLGWVRHLGVVEIDSGYGATSWHADLRLILGN